MGKINLAEKFALFDDRWIPKIVGEMNDLHIKVVKIKGEFVWHTHEDTDELFLVTQGEMVIRQRGPGVEPEVRLGPGEIYVVPRGVEHMPVAEEEVHAVLLEPKGTVNTGDAGGERTILEVERI